MTEEWIWDFATRKNICTPNHLLDTTTRVLLAILPEARVRRPYVVKWNNDSDSTLLCIPLAHNQTPEGLKLATPEKIERVKRAMGLDEEPSWYYIA